MKKYFVKWLPVEGELRKGDKAIEIIPNNRVFDVTQIYEQGDHKMVGDDNESINIENCRKAKLFLCSYDIPKEGEKVFCLSEFFSNGEHDPSQYINPWRNKGSEQETCKSCVKVIGEIYSDIKWIKEGDEFTEEMFLNLTKMVWQLRKKSIIIPL